MEIRSNMETRFMGKLVGDLQPTTLGRIEVFGALDPASFATSTSRKASSPSTNPYEFLSNVLKQRRVDVAFPKVRHSLAMLRIQPKRREHTGLACRSKPGSSLIMTFPSRGDVLGVRISHDVSPRAAPADFSLNSELKLEEV
jgi:hypothetical protein